MKHKIRSRSFLRLPDETGSAMVIAMLVLVAVTIIGIATSRMSTTEMLITGNDIVKKASFFNADAGTSTIPRVISMAVNEKRTPFLGATSEFTYEDTGTSDTGTARTFYRELAGFISHDADIDIFFQNDGIHDTDVDVQRLGLFPLEGGGTEFGSGIEGFQTSLKGVRFILDSFGAAEKNAVTHIQARYLKVLGAGDK